MNILRPGDNELVPLDYSDLLQNILTVLQNQQTKNPFSISSDSNRLLIDIDEIAFRVASLPIENPLGGSASSARSASVNFSQGSRDSFTQQVQLLRDCLTRQLESVLKQSKPETSLQQYIASFITDLSTFKGNSQSIGFTYPFGKYQNLQKQRLSLRQSNSGTPLLKSYKLTIKLENTRQLDEQLKASLNNFINIQFAANTEEEREELGEILNDLVENTKSDFHKLKYLMNTRTLGKVQREAKIRYLEFLLDNLEEDKDAIYLEDFIRRLRLIEQYIDDDQKADGHYQVNYADHSFNYKDLFSTADAFDMLPIISLIAGQLGETTDEERGELQFIFGLKLKFNGKVQSQGSREVFEYNLNLLDPDSQEHQEGLADTFRSEAFARKVLKIAFLYYFIFASRSNPLAENYEPDSELTYNPASSFEQHVLPILQGSDEIAKQNLFRKLKEGFERFNVNTKITKLKRLLQKRIRAKSKFQPRTYRIQIGVKQGILERDIRTILNHGTFFKTVFNESSREELKYNEALKYISVGDYSTDPSFLCTLPADIQIRDIDYFSTTDTHAFSMEYDIEGVRAIPVLLTPQEENCNSIVTNICKKQKSLVFAYQHQRLREKIFTDEESLQAFVYRVTFSLLAYTCLKLVLDTTKWLFIPIVRLHLNDKENPSPEEDFMRSLFSSISHLLNEEHRSSSQGFCIKKYNTFTIRNGLTSLYSVLPKKFQFSTHSPSQVDKLAIIVVSSRESDASKRDDYKISNFLGEVVKVQKSNDTIRLQLSKTFSDNYSSHQIHNNPTVLLDEVSRLYKQGYRHFFYIAKAPYSRTLNLTRTEKDEELFFMSKAIISAFIKDKPDIKIYPIFFDTYFVVKLQDPKVSSLYIQDISELTSLVEDPSKQAVVFFNLFNGITVGDEKYYNGVISYATLLNIYEGILDDKNLRMGLMYDGSLKDELLQYLTLYHFSRYEAAPRRDRNISLKLNPYQNIIGDDSVGAKSIFKHMTGGVKFNSLAFLTEVRKALNVQQENK